MVIPERRSVSAMLLVHKAAIVLLFLRFKSWCDIIALAVPIQDPTGDKGDAAYKCKDA